MESQAEVRAQMAGEREAGGGGQGLYVWSAPSLLPPPPLSGKQRRRHGTGSVGGIVTALIEIQPRASGHVVTVPLIVLCTLAFDEL